ncbi:MAG: 50S ribosomal protein L11 methyltransferase [Tissierellia bacterium]|nr:50S ribosomal protein L11 methyltransferase [Tissierellia bacterium]
MDKWTELTITTEYDKWILLEKELYNYGFYSFELIDPRMDQIDNREGRWDFFDEEIFNDVYDGITVKLYSQEDSKEFEELLQTIYEEDLGETNLREIDDEDWKNNWKSFYSTMEIGNKFTIKPTWEEYSNSENRYVIEIDPGMAFGTGGHETTKMCLESLEKYIKPGDDVLDIGSGSGILAIASKFLGAKTVIGTDLDEKAVEIAKENAKLNDVDIEFKVSNLFSNVEDIVDVIVSNIVAEILVLLLDDIKNHLKPGGYFISSGIIEERSKLVEDALEKNNLEIIEKTIDNQWVSLVGRLRDA